MTKRKFDEWYGCAGDGYKNREDAERRAKHVISEMEHVKNLLKVDVKVVDRFGDGTFWVRNETSYMSDHVNVFI